MSAHEETGCGSVSESADCHPVVTQKRWHSTRNELAASHCESSACSRSPKGWSKALAVICKKAAVEWSFKQLLCCTILGPTEWKSEFATKVRYPNSHSVYVPTETKNLLKRPRHTRALLQRKHDRLDVWKVFLLSLVGMGVFLWDHHQRNCYWKMTSKQVFSSLCDSQHTERRESYVPLRKIRHQWRVFSGLYLSQLSRFNEVRPPCLYQGPNFEHHGSVFHYSFCGLKTFQCHTGNAHVETGFGSVSEIADCHTVVTKKRWHSTGSEPATWCCELSVCFRNPKVWNKALTVRSKKTVIGWSFKQLLGHTILGLMERRMCILLPKSSIQIHTEYVYMQNGKIFQK